MWRLARSVTSEAATPPLLVVDYLQKVFVPGGGDEEERVTHVVEGLKDMALDLGVPVLAIVASDKDGLSPGKRLRAHHLRGSSALAYEADVVLLLNNKYDVVARHHLVYDTTASQRYLNYVVLSIEKNRGGVDRVDLEMRKRFEQSRFDTAPDPGRPSSSWTSASSPSSVSAGGSVQGVVELRVPTQPAGELAHREGGGEQRARLVERLRGVRQVARGERRAVVRPRHDHQPVAPRARGTRAGAARPPAAPRPGGPGRCPCPRR